MLQDKRIDKVQTIIKDLYNKEKFDEFVSHSYLLVHDVLIELRDILLGHSYDHRMSPYFKKRALIMNGMEIISEGMLCKLLNYTEEKNSKEGIDSVIYILYYDNLKKYFSFQKPQSHLGYFLLKNISTGFRDFLRSEYSSFNKEKVEIHTIIEKEYYPHLYIDSDIDLDYFLNKMNPLSRMILYYIIDRGLTKTEAASKLGYSYSEFYNHFKRHLVNMEI